MSSEETLPAPLPVRRPYGRSHPAWYGGLTGQDFEVFKASCENPMASYADIGRAFFPKAKHPAAKARKILDRVRNSTDIANLLRIFGPNVQKVFKVLDEALEAENVFISKSGDIVTNPDHRVRLQAAKLILDIQTPKGPAVVQNTTTITFEKERREARKYRENGDPDEVYQRRLTLEEEFERQQRERETTDE